MSKIFKFIPNKEDNLHCLQACYQMVYESMLDAELSDSEVDANTNFVSGKPTWPFAAMLSLMENGLEVIYMENFPLSEFVRDPVNALRVQFDDESVVNQIIETSDLDKEKQLAKQFLEHNNLKFIQQTPTFEDIEQYLAADYITMINVNYWKLLGEEKYAGHFVLVENINGDELTIQNPGLPPIENQVVSKELFLSAWYYPDIRAAHAYFIRKID